MRTHDSYFLNVDICVECCVNLSDSVRLLSLLPSQERTYGKQIRHRRESPQNVHNFLRILCGFQRTLEDAAFDLILDSLVLKIYGSVVTFRE